MICFLQNKIKLLFKIKKVQGGIIETSSLKVIEPEVNFAAFILNLVKSGTRQAQWKLNNWVKYAFYCSCGLELFTLMNVWQKQTL